MICSPLAKQQQKNIHEHKTSSHWTDPSGKFSRAKASGQNTNSLVFLQEEGLSQAIYLRNQTLPATPESSCSTSTGSKHSAAILQTSDKSGTKEISTRQKSPKMGIAAAGNKTLDFKPQLWQQKLKAWVQRCAAPSYNKQPSTCPLKRGQTRAFFKPCVGIWLRFVQLQVVMNSTEVTAHAVPGLDYSSKQQLSVKSTVANHNIVNTQQCSPNLGAAATLVCSCSRAPGGNGEGVSLTSQGDPSHQLKSTCQLGDHNL